MANKIDFSTDRKDETSLYSKTPLGILALMLKLLRERFSPEISGLMKEGFAYYPVPPSTDIKYKESQLFIESAESEFAKVENFCPAVVAKRGAFQYQYQSFYGNALIHAQSGGHMTAGIMTGGMLLSCYARSFGEVEILSNLVFEFFIRCRQIIQSGYELTTCQPTILTEVRIINEGQQEDQRLYQVDVQLALTFDFNTQWVPIAPLLKEVLLTLKNQGDPDTPAQKILVTGSPHI